jgi:hypothetical protein
MVKQKNVQMKLQTAVAKQGSNATRQKKNKKK